MGEDPQRAAFDNVVTTRGDAETHERLAIMKRGQILGLVALVLTLATIVTLAAIGQPWVAGSVATTGLAIVVAIFVTGQYHPAQGRTPMAAPRQPSRTDGLVLDVGGVDLGRLPTALHDCRDRW